MKLNVGAELLDYELPKVREYLDLPLLSGRCLQKGRHTVLRVASVL